jgi:hypothetical protein
MVEQSRGPGGDPTFVIWPHTALSWAVMRRLLCVLTAAIAAVAIWSAPHLARPLPVAQGLPSAAYE